jgi:hypothetical protein
MAEMDELVRGHSTGIEDLRWLPQSQQSKHQMTHLIEL